MMSRLRRFFLRVQNVVRPGRPEPDLARELVPHFALMEDDFLRRGMTPEEARLAATRAFGGVEHAKDLHRDARSFVWLDDARRDLRHAVRMLVRAPGFTAIVVLTLALGIGANTAIFSVVNAVLLKPLPFRGSDRLVRFYENVPAAESPDGKPRRMNGMYVRDFLDLRGRTRALSDVISYGAALVTITGGGDNVRLELAPVSPELFPMLGVQPILGRLFTSADEQSGSDRIIVLSYGAWQRYFAGDPQVLGKNMRFNGSRLSGNVALGADYTVVGVMPSTFHFPDDAVQFWVPLVLAVPTDGRPRRTPVIARLADGVSMQAAAAEVSTIVRDLRSGSQGPQASGPSRFEFVRVQDEVGAPVKPALVVLTAAVGFVLLIACANVANLLLARTAARQREMAIRVAIGAGRGRLIRQVLTESVLLSVLGGAAGTVLASGGVSLFRILATNLSRVDLGSSATFPRLDAVGIDASVWAFAVVVSLLTGLLFGLAPALRHSRTITPSLVVSRRHVAQGVLVIAEIAMATVLFVAGGLLIHSLVKLARVDLGYNPANLLTFQVSPPGPLRPLAQQKAFAEDLVARLQSAPGVHAAAYANQLPMVSLRDTAGGFKRTRDLSTARSQDGPDARFVSRDYFRAMGIRVIAGRGLTKNDGAGRPRVLVINQELARRDFPGENPIGQEAYVGSDPNVWQIVGVVDDVRQFGLDRAPEPQFFADLRQWPETGPIFPVGAYYAIRTSGDPTLALSHVGELVRQLEPQASIENVATMDQIVSNSMTRPRMYAVLLGIFAGVAVVLAAAGIYGVMACSVAHRTREIGIRMALGARPAMVLAMVLRQSAILTMAGIILGLAGATATTRYLQGLLFGLTPLDPATFFAVSLMFIAVATIASYVPASRATAVDPSIALRSE